MADTPRRRSKLMNEVLPSPVSANSSSPRARTIAHLRNMMSEEDPKIRTSG